MLYILPKGYGSYIVNSDKNYFSEINFMMDVESLRIKFNNRKYTYSNRIEKLF